MTKTNAKLKIFVILNNSKKENSKVRTKIIIAIRKKRIKRLEKEKEKK